MKRVSRIFVSLAIFILTGSAFYITSANAETNSSLPHPVPTGETTENIENPATINEDQLKFVYKLTQVNQALQDNQEYIKKIELEVENATSKVTSLKEEIKFIENRIKKRNSVMKERALTLQQSGGNVTYLEVLLGSTSFGDFLERVGAIVTIFEADRTILEQQESEKLDLEGKRASLDKELASLANMKSDLEGMQAQLIEQQKQFESLSEQEETDSNEQVAPNTNLDSLPIIDDEYIAAIITAGYPYIGNSVYVFGGGRNEYDIANGRFDCSGFVHWAFAQAGVKIGASTDVLAQSGSQVPVEEVKPGDLVFFDTYKKDGHVGIYIGDGKFIGSQSDLGVSIADMTTGYWLETFNGRVVRIIENETNNS
ncbi:NlpC/P60 family protein [Bacillus sp. MRMR6]|uniref:C40 family peptidase n=1 Tax=Bacillus sp. MRMR6 TaxID=1928617 RepID=UPI0009FB3DD7|nr:C40 family peptidase [Bacillus sp. MRMR6]